MKISEPNQAMRYALAVVLCAVACVVARPLDAPSSCFLLAVIAASLYGGRGSAWVAMLLSAFLFEFYFLPPAGQFVHSRAAFLRLAFFIVAMVLTAAMIEARRRSERERLQMEESLRHTQSKLAQATQIATAAELAAAIVHEISQPLSAMVTNGQASLRWLGATPPNIIDGRAAVERIVRDGKDAAGIIKGLRSLFGRAALDKSELDLREIVDEVVALLRGKAAHEGVLLEVQMPENLPHVMGDKIQLQQVLMNLVNNGIESMQTVVDRPKRLVIRASQEKDDILTSVEDQGVGVENFDAIFDAFFTTKEKGMGMGLAICRSIIEVHEGRLSAAPGVAGGSVFSFSLPRLKRSVS